jgi:phenylacetic acid degradation protein
MPAFVFEGLRPVVDRSSYVHPAAVLIGDVVVGARCFVGPGAALRGDMGRITLRPGCNVQDNCVVHSFPGQDVLLEEGAHIGHSAVLHGCTVGRGVLVGMHAVVMDGAVLGEECFVAAMALVRAQMQVPPRMLAAGSPARVIRALREEEIAWKAEGTRLYQWLADRYLQTCMEVEPLPELDAERPPFPSIPYTPKT